MIANRCVWAGLWAKSENHWRRKISFCTTSWRAETIKLSYLDMTKDEQEVNTCDPPDLSKDVNSTMAGWTLGAFILLSDDRASHPLPVAGVGVRVEPQQGLLVHNCSDRLAGHSWVSFPPRRVCSSLLWSSGFLSSGDRKERQISNIQRATPAVRLNVMTTQAHNFTTFKTLKDCWCHSCLNNNVIFWNDT